MSVEYLRYRSVGRAEFWARPEPISVTRHGPELTAKAVRDWLAKVEVQTLYIEPGSPWENGYVESFNGKFRDELLDREIFYTLDEAKVLIERWRTEYNQYRPHSSLGYRPPAPEAIEVAPLEVKVMSDQDWTAVS